MHFHDVIAIIKDERSVITYMQESRLIAQSMVCHKCRRNMTVQEYNQSLDKATFRCSFCKSRTSIRKGSIFEGSHLSLSNILMIIYFMSAGILQKTISEMLNISERSIVEWEAKLRNVYTRKLHSIDMQLGGQDIVVQVDESVISRAKPTRNVHARPRSTQWVFGMFDTTRHIGVIRLVPDRSREALLPIIQWICRPGTIIRSDGWAAYVGVEELGFRHQVVVHERHFTDPITGWHTNNVENYWKRCKAKLKHICGAARHIIPSYLDEFMWHERYGTLFFELFYHIILHIAEQTNYIE